MEKRYELSFEKYISLLKVDYRWSMVKEGKLIIKLTRYCTQKEIKLLKEIGFKEDGKTWYISVEIIEEYLNNRYQKIIKKFDKLLKQNNINDAEVEFDSPYFKIKSSNNEKLCEIFNGYNLRTKISHDEVIINVWNIPF